MKTQNIPTAEVTVNQQSKLSKDEANNFCTSTSPNFQFTIPKVGALQHCNTRMFIQFNMKQRTEMLNKLLYWVANDFDQNSVTL